MHERAVVLWAEHDPPTAARLDGCAAALLMAVSAYEHGQGASWDGAVRRAVSGLHDAWASAAREYALRCEACP